MSNRAWQSVSPGKLKLVDLPIPKPSANEVLVRIQAVALNHRDELIVNHDPFYPVPSKPNLVPCCDAAGVVEEAWTGSAWKKGDRVVLLPGTWISGQVRPELLEDVFGSGHVDGTLQEWMLVNETRLVTAPDGLSMEECCTIFGAGATAWNALQYGPFALEPGMTVLTQGTGGVSCYAIQIATAIGATVVATSSSDEKLKVVEKLGAKHLINYRKTPNFATEVL